MDIGLPNLCSNESKENVFLAKLLDFAFIIEPNRIFNLAFSWKDLRGLRHSGCISYK